MGINLAQFQAFVNSVETSIKNDVAGFQGFGGTLSQDVAAVTVDAEKILNWGLAAFQLSGNTEAAVLAPFAAWAEGVVNSIETALGIGASTTTAPATVTAAASAIAAAPAIVGAQPPARADAFNTGDGTHVGDDPDAGAIGG